MTNYSDRLVSFIWDVADLLRGHRPPEYRKVMLPMTVLRRLDCVLEPTKSKVLEEHKKLKGQNSAYLHKMLQRAARQQFYNTSKYDFERLKADSEGLAQNLLHYIHGFSPEVRALFENFGFDQQIQKLDKTNRLFKLIQKFSEGSSRTAENRGTARIEAEGQGLRRRRASPGCTRPCSWAAEDGDTAGDPFTGRRARSRSRITVRGENGRELMDTDRRN